MNQYLTPEQKCWLDQMQSLLAHNVPRFIRHIKNRGGVNDEEFAWLKSEEESIDYPLGVVMRADEYLLYPKNEKVFKQGLFVLVKALAIMSFIPDGVRLFGLHFCSQTEDFVSKEDEGET